MWFLYRKVILTKDNLAKRRWNGCTKCAFCDSEESVDHLFFHCPLSRQVWRIVYFTYNIPPPSNTTNMFGNWLNGVDQDTKARIRIGICALLWALWNCRNDVVFNKAGNTNFLQVFLRATHWIHEWSYLLPVDQREPMESGCTRLEKVAWDIYNLGGWWLSRRLQDA